MRFRGFHVGSRELCPGDTILQVNSAQGARPGQAQNTGLKMGCFMGNPPLKWPIDKSSFMDVFFVVIRLRNTFGK